jgi:2-dehydro-3-deoxy-D-arabinonate dehydratase
MHIIRYADSDGQPRVGVSDEHEAVRPLAVRSLAELLALPMADIRATVAAAAGTAPLAGNPLRTLAPVDGHTEVWASGVTYRRSREARIEESQDGDVYTRVYHAQRPELFFKSVAWRVVGDGDAIAVRADSDSNTPEPELALVLNAAAEVVGLTVCNDVSSRSIEGENPLYLPQAKVYTGSCALGPGIRPIWEVSDPMNLAISCTITRAGTAAWSATTSTALLHRNLSDLIGYLYRAMDFPHGAILSTGTGIVPDLDFTLDEDDNVRIEIEDVGVLTNPVIRVPARGTAG